MSALTNKQQAFCREYVVDFNATKAAIRAGYSEHTARKQGSRLLTYADITQGIAKLVKPKCEESGVTVERVLKELTRLAFLDPNDLLNEDGSLKPISEIPEDARRAIGGLEIKETFDKDGESRVQLAKIKIIDKGIALERLGKYLKMFNDTAHIDIPADANFTMVIHKS